MVKCEGWKEERYTAMCMAMGGGVACSFHLSSLRRGGEGRGTSTHWKKANCPKTAHFKILMSVRAYAYKSQ